MSDANQDPVLNAFMNAMEPAAPAAEAAPQQEAPPQQTQAPETEEVRETEPVPEGADAPEQETAEQDVETIEIDPEAELFEQTLTESDGSKVTKKLSLKELQQGYLRQADYTRKTQEVAKQRAQVQEEARQASKAATEAYEKRLGELQGIVMKAVAPELSSVDWNKLASEDAFEYVRLSNRANQVQQLIKAIQSEQESATKARHEEEQKKQTEEWQKSLAVLQEKIPGFGTEVVKRIIDAGTEWGFTQDEVAQWRDHRIIRMLHALTERKAIEAKKPEIEKKVAVVTKVLKPGAKPAARSPLADARAKFKKSGRAEDGLAIFESFLR